MSMDGQQAGPDSGTAQAPVSLDRAILDSLTGLVKFVGAAAHDVSGRIGLAPHDLLAMFKLDDGLSMKELAQRMACDASFVTAVADTLERHGFVRRESSQRDRRVRNLVLTPEGLAAKERLLAELGARMPWCYALDETERREFLRLLRKMCEAPPAAARHGTGSAEKDEAETRTRSLSLSWS